MKARENQYHLDVENVEEVIISMDVRTHEITEMQEMMMQTCGKKVRVTCEDGKIFEGINENFTQPMDNEPEVAAICIQEDGCSHLTELTEPEIKEIEVIESEK